MRQLCVGSDQAAIRETTIRETTLRETTLRETSIRETSIRETTIRETEGQLLNARSTLLDSIPPWMRSSSPL